MKEYRVKKSVSKEPLLWGMKIPQFVVFISILIICAILLTGGVTIRKLLIVTTVLVASYFALQALSNKNVIKIFFSDRFPGSVKNDLR